MESTITGANGTRSKVAIDAKQDGTARRPIVNEPCARGQFRRSLGCSRHDAPLKVAVVGASISNSPDGRERFAIRAHLPALKALSDLYEVAAVCTSKMETGHCGGAALRGAACVRQRRAHAD